VLVKEKGTHPQAPHPRFNKSDRWWHKDVAGFEQMSVMPALAGARFSEKAFEPMPAGFVVMTFDNDFSAVNKQRADLALEIGLQNGGPWRFQVAIGVS